MDFKKISDTVWELPAEGEMKVPVRVYADEQLLAQMQRDRSMGQAKNVATLPGIVKASFVMPDGHEGFAVPV